LFQYIDDKGETRTVGSADVNEYLREISGQDFTAKDFRTWAGTMLAAETLLRGGEQAARRGRKAITSAVQIVAARLGNTVAVCRKCYIHPAIFECFLGGTLAGELNCLCQSRTAALPSREAEAALLKFLMTAAGSTSRRNAG
jgi:DNA topoisomerase-1